MFMSDTTLIHHKSKTFFSIKNFETLDPLRLIDQRPKYHLFHVLPFHKSFWLKNGPYFPHSSFMYYFSSFSPSPFPLEYREAI